MRKHKVIRVETLMKYLNQRWEVAHNSWLEDTKMAYEYPDEVDKTSGRVGGADYQYMLEGKMKAYREIELFLDKR